MVLIRALLMGQAMLQQGQLQAERGTTAVLHQAATMESPSQQLGRLLMMRLSSDPHANSHGDHADADGDHKVENPLIREEDHQHWIVFFVSFFGLLIFDNFVLHRNEETISFWRAVSYTIFFIMCAMCFNVYVYHVRGADDAFQWGTGYLLEWMLSVDNLFVFHRVFSIFKTPDNQKHRPLFFGIIGAIVFRMAFFCVEELLMHHVSWIHIVFGIFLIYTGVKCITTDDDDDPTDGPVFKWLEARIPFVPKYAADGRFFVRVPVNPDTGKIVEAADQAAGQPKIVYETRATRLFLVVICLEITDLVFAVDSVSAIVAQIPDLFLAYTACVYSMLGLRACFFVIDELVRMFIYLQYGVAAILIFLGFKLIFRSYVHVPPLHFLCLLISVLAISIIASIIKDKYFPEKEDPDEVSSVASSPHIRPVTPSGCMRMEPIDEDSARSSQA